MDIKEVLNLPNETEVQARNGAHYRVMYKDGIITLTKGCCALILTSELVNAEYELVRKKLNFFEAMKLVDEGKIVESNFSKYVFKKAMDGAIVCKRKGVEEEFDTNDICAEEILDDWYEVTE